MPKVTIDLLNLDVIKDTIIILQDMFNDKRLPEELHIEYSNRFDELWNKKTMTKEEKIDKVEELMAKKPNSKLKDAITYDKDGFPTINATGCGILKEYNENGGL